MNFHITRLRLASVGPEPARFDPLDISLVNAEGTGPADTVIYLPNTGGKTVLLRLIFSVLHPPIVERIGSEETARRGKNLAGYVLERDTAHVLIEWRRAEGGRFVDDEVLLTGLVAEWRGGRPTNNPSDLVRAWYSIRGRLDAAGADRMSFDVDTSPDNGHARRRISLRRFREHLAELGAGPRRGGPLVTITETQRDWIDHLDAIGLDRALFRYQGEMNHNEAGASAIARFTNDLDFIRFFLNAVMDPSELAVLDREFEEVADKVRRYPEYERRLRFEEAALTELDPLSALVARAVEAQAAAAGARHTALTLLASFSGAMTSARDREQLERTRYRSLDGDARRLGGQAERLRDEWREYRRIGAALWLREAADNHKRSQHRSEAADLDVRGWAIAEELVRLAEASAEVGALDAAYDAELKRLRPLQSARDESARLFAGRLASDAVLATAAESSELRRASAAKTKGLAARDEQTQGLVEAAKLDTTRDAHERELVEIAGLRARLVTLQYLTLSERADAAYDREAARATSANARIDMIGTQTRAFENERVDIDAIERQMLPRRHDAQQQYDRVHAAVESATSERTQLAAHTLVIELAETDSFDLELVGAGIAQRLLGRVHETDAARIHLELRGVEDRRALRGLDTHGLLPSPPDVEEALDRLRAGGISGATPGPRYVAEAIPASARADVAARRADLVGGIVLTDSADLERARVILTGAALDPSTIIAVGSASEIVEAEQVTTTNRTFVIPPAESVWDRAAAVSERARREARMSALEQELASLDARAADARTLADALSRHLSAYPHGWLALRRAERDTIAAELNRLDTEQQQRDERKRNIATAVQALREEESVLRKEAREAEHRANELAHLKDAEAKAITLAASIEGLRSEAEEWRHVAADAGRSASLADAEAADAQRNAHNQRNAADRIRGELRAIALAEEFSDPSVEEATLIAAKGEDVTELRARYAELDRRLAGETSNSELAARRAAAIKTRDRLRQAIEQYPATVQSRAKLLIDRPEAGDFAGRRAAAERCDLEAGAARAAAQETYSIREQAQRDHQAIEEEIRTSRRTFKLPDDRVPPDRHTAARRAAETRLNADAIQTQATTAERERSIAEEGASQAKALGDALASLVTQLEMNLHRPADSLLPIVPAYEGTIDQAREVGLHTTRCLTEAIERETDSEKAWRAQDASVRAVLVREEFADLAGSDRLYRRLTQTPPETLADEAADLVVELRASIGILRTELATMSEDVKLVTTSLAKNVNKALSYLKLAEARSKMPATLRDWAGAPFLTIRFDRPPGDQLEARLVTFVTEVVNRPANRPTGTALLLQALERSVGQFAIQILKPNEGFALMRVPVAELSSQTFSNGQRSTVATALMLMLSELRRQSRGSAKTGASVGTLLLDNPFGNANAGFLIEVQRTVAAAAGIQLVYSTGIADFGALRHFPNAIALSNDAARRTMRRYVRANPALLELLVPSDGGPGGRISATRIATVSHHDADVSR